MDNKNNDNKNNDLKTSTAKILNLYGNAGYFSIYGLNLFLFIFITFAVYFIYVLFKVFTNMSSIKDDWVNQRCNPAIIPLAGFINKPVGENILIYTGENFNYCLNSVLKTIVGHFMSVTNFTMRVLASTIALAVEAINQIRIMFDKIRKLIEKIIREIMSSILNFIIPLQQIIIAFKDIMGRVQGTFVVSLFSVVGIYDTIKSALGLISNYIIRLLIILASIIVVFALGFFSLPMAIAYLVIFISIAVPLIIILVVLAQSMGIYPDNPLPSKPKIKMSVCFSPETPLKKSDGTYVSIKDIQVGDVLYNCGMVSAKMKFNTEYNDIFNLNDIIVSGNHVIKYKDKWIFVHKHPDAKQIFDYKEKYGDYIYCINTTSKFIEIKNHLFSDWDDLYDDKNMQSVLNKGIPSYIKKIKESIHYCIDGGFLGSNQLTLMDGSKREIKNIQPGDILCGNIRVITLVEIECKSLHPFFYVKEINNENEPIIICCHNIENFLNGQKNKQNENKSENKFEKQDEICYKKIDLQNISIKEIKNNDNKIYHLITDKKHFYMKDYLFLDYNSLIENLLE